MNQGQTVEQMQQKITLPKYQHFDKYEDWLPLNIKGAYEQLEQSSGRYGQNK